MLNSFPLNIQQPGLNSTYLYALLLVCVLKSILFGTFQGKEDDHEHICALVDFAIAMKQCLEELNKHSFNNFQLRVGE